jgi:hypothetical protein
MEENFAYKKLTKSQRIKEAKRRIDETLNLGSKYLDLTGLGLEDEDLKLIPEFPTNKEFKEYLFYGNEQYDEEKEDIKEQFKNNWYQINLAHNNLINVKNLPTSYIIELSYNKIKTLELTNKVYNLGISHTEIKSLKNIKNIENVLNMLLFYNTPLEKKLIPHRKIDNNRVIKNKNSSNFKYETYIIPKGTVIFRAFNRVEDLPSVYVGYEPFLKKDKDGNYYLHKDQYTFFYTSPRSFFSNDFGRVRTVFVLQNDVEVLLGFKPAIRVKNNMISQYNRSNIFFEACDKDHKIRKYSSYSYECLRPEYKEKNIAGWFSNWFIGKASESSVKSLKDLKYTPMYETFHKDFYTPELAIYPKNKREFGDVITKVEDFNTDWLNSHISEFNYKPLMIFDDTVSTEEYKEKVLQFMKPEGFTDETGTYHITVNKKDGTYILAELASEETLKDCLPVEADKESYLIEFVKNQ